MALNTQSSRATALSGGPPPPPPAIPNPAQQNVPQQAQIPAPSHDQTVAALRHFQIFLKMEKGWLDNPDLGKSDMKDAFIEGFTKTVADRVATPAQAVSVLATVPERPYEQRLWVENHYSRNLQARDILLSHHAAAFAGQGPQPPPNSDSHMKDISGMMTAHYTGGQS